MRRPFLAALRQCLALGASHTSVPQAAPAAGGARRSACTPADEPLFERLEDRRLLASTLVLSEFMASNTKTLLDAESPAQYEDWIEIRNPTASAVSLNGWYLTDTDNNLAEWPFPAAASIPANGYLVVFASGKNATINGQYHTNFKLNPDGEYLALCQKQADGVTILPVDEYAPTYPQQLADVSYGLAADGASHGYFPTPTPGTANGSAKLGLAAPVIFSQPDGIYTSSFSLSLSTVTPGAGIRYTLDGTLPNDTSGILYTGPIAVGPNTTIVRAVAFESNWITSLSTDETFLYLNNALWNQTKPNDPRYSATWEGGYTADFDMDTDITSPTGPYSYASRLPAAMTSIPTLSIITDPTGMFGDSTTNGLQTHFDSSYTGPAWERQVSLELINPDGTPGFQINGSLQIQGGAARDPTKGLKHSFRIQFKDDYGPTSLDYPLLGTALGVVSTFDSITLRAGYNNSWVHPFDSTQRDRAQYIQDEWARDTFAAMGQVTSHGTFVQLYINGLYWGLYNPAERPDDAFAANYWGGDATDYDVVHCGNGIEIIAGGWTRWDAMMTKAAADLTVQANYEALKPYLDVTNVADYMIMNLYAGNNDWPGNNWYCIDNHTTNGPFRFAPWDEERTLEGTGDNRTTVTGSPGRSVDAPAYLYQRLMTSPEFRQLFADRLQKQLGPGGPLSAPVAAARYQALANQVDLAVIGESARWGDARRDNTPGAPPRNPAPAYGPPYTHDVEWVNEKNYLINTYFPGRTTTVLNQFRALATPLYPPLQAVTGAKLNEAPIFSQAGGNIAVPFSLTITNPDTATGKTYTVYYTLDGTDPRVAYTGAVAATAKTYTAALSLTDTTQVRARIRNVTDSTWSPLVDYTFTNPTRTTGGVVIDEIFYDPTNKTEPSEFIELTNTGAERVDLSNWSFTSGIAYTFPAGTYLAAGAYLVVAQNPTVYQTKFKKTALGPFTVGVPADTGNLSLSNQGDDVVLRGVPKTPGDPTSGPIEDEVNYGLGFPWPTTDSDVTGGVETSIELINPLLDNSLGGNWRSATVTVIPGSDTTVIADGSIWSYRKGTSEASTPDNTTWRQRNFTLDGTWLQGAAPIGYNALGADDALTMATTLGDMQQKAGQTGYSTIFLRQTFTISNPLAITNLRLEAQWDDGFNAWINGVLIAGQYVGSSLAYNALASGQRNESQEDSFTTVAGATSPAPSTYLLAGANANVLAVELFNVALTSSDAFFNTRLVLSTLTQTLAATPGLVNSDNAANAPPAIRQVQNDPQQPVAGQPVTVTAKVTDPNGVQSVNLLYQLVDPGSYIEVTDAAYSTNWTSVAMYDDGTHGDALAADGTYTAVLPGTLQQHRRLVRYRIQATDNSASHLAVTVPYADDSQPNFAYYCYNGVPIYTAAADPGVAGTLGQVVTYDTGVTSRLPVYQLIAKNDSVLQSQGLKNLSSGSNDYSGQDYLWSGTFVYDGVVYDNIHYRARGGVWRYAMGKNMWKFSFNRGHNFQGKDNYGNPYDTTVDNLNLGACIQQADYSNRGEQGMYESVGWALFQLAGVDAANTNFTEFRVVDNASEAGATQYDGDFWGLYLVVEQMDGHFLSEHNLPDGNLYKMDTGDVSPAMGGGGLNNQGATQPSDNSDLIAFQNGNTANQTEAWWRTNFDLSSYYSYRSIIEAIHQYDDASGKNYFYYHNPVTNQWEVMPWDLDLTWSDTMYGSGAEPMRDTVSIKAPFQQEYHNRLREIRDLLYNPEQTGLLIDSMARIIDDPTSPYSMVDADRAQWDYNPIMTSSYVNGSKSGQGRFYAGGSGNTIPAPGGFAGMVQKMKNYIVSRGAWIDSTLLNQNGEEAAIPRTPTATYTGLAGDPINQLTFSTGAFAAGNLGGTFAGMEWRIAEVTDPTSASYDPSQPPHYEINATWDSGTLTTYSSTVTIPGMSLKPGATYRVRVRMKDSAGRWSHWSTPGTGAGSQFVAGRPNTTQAQNLRITKVMYHPEDPPVGSGFTADDFEYVEVRNIGIAAVNLQGMSFTDGISFTFGNLTLGIGQAAVIYAKTDAFGYRYGFGGGRIVAGNYSGSLDNNSDHLTLKDSAGYTIEEFKYHDWWYPSTDGQGYALVARTPTANPTQADNATYWRPGTVVDGAPGFLEPDTTLPTVTAGFDHARAPHTLAFHFSEDVSASFSMADVTLLNLTTGQTVSSFFMSAKYDAASNTAEVWYPLLAGGLLPEGHYRATLASAGITDAAGNHLDGDPTHAGADDLVFTFTVLAGDLNSDGVVDPTEIGTLMANLGNAGVWSDGDFNNSRQVDVTDLALAARNLGRVLPPDVAPAPLPEVAAAPAAASPSPAASEDVIVAASAPPVTSVQTRSSVGTPLLMTSVAPVAPLQKKQGPHPSLFGGPGGLPQQGVGAALAPPFDLLRWAAWRPPVAAGAGSTSDNDLSFRYLPLWDRPAAALWRRPVLGGDPQNRDEDVLASA